MNKIGFIGLGNMGSKMVENLLKNDYELIGYDTNSQATEKLVPQGLKKVTDLNELPNDINIIITMLPNGEIVEDNTKFFCINRNEIFIIHLVI